jgi:hypothetical protein
MTTYRTRRPISEVLRDSEGNIDFTSKDYSVTPDYFFYTAGSRMSISKIFAVLYGNIQDATQFGTGPALENGLHAEVVNEHGQLMFELTVPDLDGINNNSDFVHFFDSMEVVGAKLPKTIRWLWTRPAGDGDARTVELLPGWTFRVRAADDFTTRCDGFHVHFQGLELEPISYEIP